MACRAARNIRLYLNKPLKSFYIQSRTLRSLSSAQKIVSKPQQNLLPCINTSLSKQGRSLHVTFRLFEERVVKTPPFADSVSEGDIKYGKAVGDQVAEDETVCEIETDKTAMQVPAPVAGTLLAYLVEDGSKVVANQDLFKIEVGAAAAAAPASSSASASASTPPSPPPPSSPPAAEASSGGGGGEVKVVSSPPFADSVSEGDVRFIKALGDQVAEDELVMEIETDKTSMPIAAPAAGVVQEFLVEDGAKIIANTPLFKLKLGAAPSKPAASAPSASPTPPPPAPPAATSAPIPTQAPTPPPMPSKPLAATPVAAVTPQAAARPPPSNDGSKPLPGLRTEERVKMNRMRLRIAARLKEAQNTCAMLTTFNEVDMSNIIELRKTYQDAFVKKHGVKLGFMSPFLKASAYALMDGPAVNAVIDDTEIVYRDYVDISVAVATPKGLVVPVLRNVEVQNCADIEKNLAELGQKAKEGQLAIEDMDGGTFTISNGGVFGSLMGTPIINPPQSAILGMHGVFDRPVAIKGEVKIRPMMYLALTYDHRLVDGREAVTFLRKIKSSIEDPRTILLDL